MMSVKKVMRFPLKLVYYGLVMPVVVLFEYVLSDDSTIRSSVKEFLEVDFFKEKFKDE